MSLSTLLKIVALLVVYFVFAALGCTFLAVLYPGWLGPQVLWAVLTSGWFMWASLRVVLT